MTTRTPAVASRAFVLGLLFACAAVPASAAEYRYRPVHVTDRVATFAVRSLAKRSVVSARVVAPGARTRPVPPTNVRRAAGAARPLRDALPRSWSPLRAAARAQMTLRVRTRRPKPKPTPPSPVPPDPSPSPSPPAAPPATAWPQLPSLGSPLWTADGESSMASEWASNSSVPAAASPPSPDPSRIAQSTFRAQSQRSYRFEMRAGDDSYGARAELGQGMPALARYQDRWFRPGDERWIAMQLYLPASWPADDTWQTVLQMKPVSGGGGGPSIGLDAGHDKLKFYGNSSTWGSTAGNFFDGAGPLASRSYPLPRSRWIKLTWHVVFSANPAVGSLEVFGDLGDGNGMRTLVPRRARATMKYASGAMDPAQLRVGIYRDPAMRATASLYFDGITVATNRAAAEAHAYMP